MDFIGILDFKIIIFSNRFRQHPQGCTDRISPGDNDMQKRSKGILLAVTMGALLPSILLQIAQGMFKKENIEGTFQTENTEQTEDVQETTAAEDKFYISVLLKDGTVKDMELENYISGVVLAEMPADFEKEALKAQAVVARTYALKRHRGETKHTNCAVCTDPACCQAYCAAEDYLFSGGTQIALDKVKDAVMQTAKLVLTFNSQLIDATYFSCSGGKTEDAKAVWGTDVPYLQSVVSPGEEDASHYMDTVYFTLQEFADCLQIDKARLSGRWIGSATYTKGGGVEYITLCDQKYSGAQIRSMLGLRSTAFVMTAVGDTVTVTTKGFGHRVGMSQYGAEAMAVAGNTFDEILSYYYQGTVLEEIAN